MEIYFDHNGVPQRVGPGEPFEVIESELLHRFELIDGVAVDTYDGMTDDEVREKDYQDVVEAHLNNVDEEGNPAPLDPPPSPYGDEEEI